MNFKVAGVEEDAVDTAAEVDMDLNEEHHLERNVEVGVAQVLEEDMV